MADEKEMPKGRGRLYDHKNSAHTKMAEKPKAKEPAKESEKEPAKEEPKNDKGQTQGEERDDVSDKSPMGEESKAPDVHGRMAEEREAMYSRHRTEHRDMHGNHRSARDDMHRRHMKEMDEMAGRHASELQAGTNATAETGGAAEPEPAEA